MAKLHPLWFWTSISNSVFASVFIPFLTQMMDATPACESWTDDMKDKHSLLAMVGVGLGEIIGALAYGYIEDRYHSKVAAIVSCVMCSLATGLSLYMSIDFQFIFWLACIMSVLWGIEDGMTQSYAMSLCEF